MHICFAFLTSVRVKLLETNPSTSAPTRPRSKHSPPNLNSDGLPFSVDTSLQTYQMHNTNISGIPTAKSMMAIRGLNNSPSSFGQSLLIYGNIETRFFMKQTQCTLSAAWISSIPRLQPNTTLDKTNYPCHTHPSSTNLLFNYFANHIRTSNDGTWQFEQAVKVITNNTQSSTNLQLTHHYEYG